MSNLRSGQNPVPNISANLNNAASINQCKTIRTGQHTPSSGEDNNIYLGELAENAIGIITADRKYKRLAQSPDLSWVDSFCFGPAGQLYAVVNRLH